MRAFDTRLVFNRFHQLLSISEMGKRQLQCRLCLSSRIRNVASDLPIGRNGPEPHASNEFIGQTEFGRGEVACERDPISLGPED